MASIQRKLNSRRGASLSVALLVFLLCAMVGAVVLTAATANAGRFSHQKAEQQSYLSLRSASELLRNEISGAQLAITTTTTSHSLNDNTETSTTGTSTSGTTELSAAVGTLAQKVYFTGSAQTAKLTVAYGDLDPVTAAVSMDASYNISVTLTNSTGSMTLAIPAVSTPSTSSSTSTHNIPVNNGTSEICTITTATSTQTYTWPSGTITKGA